MRNDLSTPPANPPAPQSQSPTPPALHSSTPRPTLVIGYGNELRGDDAVGPRVAAMVQSWRLPRVSARAVHQLLPELAEAIAGARQIIFVDATADPAQSVTELHPLAPSPVPAGGLGHTSRPGDVLACAKALFERCPPAFLIKVPGENFDFDGGLSLRTQREMERALELIRGLIAAP